MTTPPPYGSFDPFPQPPVSSQPSATPVVSPPMRMPASWKVGFSFLAIGTVVVSGLVGGAFGFAAGATSAPVADAPSSIAQVAVTSDVSKQPLADEPSGGVESVADVSERVQPAVVQLEVSDPDGQPYGTGSGFVIDPKGVIITNSHVVGSLQDAKSVVVHFADGEMVDGEVVGSAPEYDVAVVKVNRVGLPHVPWGDSHRLRVGDPVIAMGSPLGLQGTVTTGIVSALDRTVVAGEGDAPSFLQAIQTDAAINPGNSGGPLLNEHGEVIGINSAIASNSSGEEAGSIGLGFAIPESTASRVAEDILSTGTARTPRIGVELDPAFEGPGARIASVTAGSPAQKAGIMSGDVIVSVNGRPVMDGTDVVVSIRGVEPGEEVEIGLERNGSQITLVFVPSADAPVVP